MPPVSQTSRERDNLYVQIKKYDRINGCKSKRNLRLSGSFALLTVALLMQESGRVPNHTHSHTWQSTNQLSRTIANHVSWKHCNTMEVTYGGSASRVYCRITGSAQNFATIITS